MPRLTTLILFASASLWAPLQLTAAQAYDPQQMQNRLERLERDIKTLESTVYRGTMPPVVRPVEDEDNPLAGVQLENRLIRIEESLQKVTGSLETLQFELNQVQRTVTEMQKAPPPPPDPAPTPSVAVPPTGAPVALDIPSDIPPSLEGDSAYTLGEPLPDKQLSSSAMDAYNAAFTLLKAGRFAEAQDAFEAFLRDHPDDTLAGNAQYWLGETYYVRRMFKEAATAFVVGYQKYPTGSKAPDNLLKLALSLKELGQTAEACQSLAQLKTAFSKVPASILRRGEEEAAALKCPQP